MGLALGLVAAEEMEFEEGLSADEILNMEFPVEYSNDDRTIDEMIAAAGTAAGAARAAGENQEINFDMDMNMDPAQYEIEYGKLQGFAGAGMASNYYRWPKAIIPYKIARGFSSSQINTIYAGMKMWMRKTCIRFVQAGSNEARSTGHNHYITIFLSNVPSKMRFNFNKVSGTSNFGMPYDYCSLMHYGATAFGGRKFTIVPKDLDYLAVIGRSRVNGADLTYTDATIVNKMYGCSNSVAQTSCPKIPCTSRWSSSTCNSLRG